MTFTDCQNHYKLTWNSLL